MQAQVDEGNIMQKAQKRKQGASSSSLGMTLINRFPYSRLIVEQIIRLFQVYQIKLGYSDEDSYTIIDNIKHMDRDQFEIAIKSIITSPSYSQHTPIIISLDHLKVGILDDQQDLASTHTWSANGAL